MSVDPLAPDYPWYTPYQFAGNIPIKYVDVDGLEPGERSAHAGLALSNPKAAELNTQAKAAGRPLSAQEWGMAAETAVGTLAAPVGWAIDARDVHTSYKEGDYLGVIFSGIGFLPGGDIVKNAYKSSKLAKKLKKFDNLPLNQKFKQRNAEFDYFSTTDNQGRLLSVEADDLQLSATGRQKYNSKTPGKEKGDHAGHMIADRFGGGGGLDNVVSQRGRVNQSDWKIMENMLAKELGDGKKVQFKVDINYKGDSKRPSSFVARYKIGNNRWKSKEFENLKKE